MWQKSVRVAILDTESTGLESFDEPVCVGIVLLEVDPYKGVLLSEVDRYHGQRYPGVEVHPRASAVNGLSRQSLIGKEFDLHRIRTLLESADVLIAHKSAFDARNDASRVAGNRQNAMVMHGDVVAVASVS